MYVCICHSITEKDIKRSIKEGAQTLQDLQVMTGCATGCGSCAEFAEDLLKQNQPARLPEFLQFYPQSSKTIASA